MAGMPANYTITAFQYKHNTGWIDIRQTDRKTNHETNKRIGVLTDIVVQCLEKIFVHLFSMIRPNLRKSGLT